MKRKRNKQIKGKKKDAIGTGKREFAVNQITFGRVVVEFRRKSTKKRGDFFSFRILHGRKRLASQEVDVKGSFKFGHARSLAKAFAKLFFKNLKDVLVRWEIKYAKQPAFLKAERVAVA